MPSRRWVVALLFAWASACGGEGEARSPEPTSPGSTREAPPRVGPCSQDSDCSLGMGCGCSCVSTMEHGYACHPCAAFPCDLTAVHAACDPDTRECIVAPGGTPAPEPPPAPDACSSDLDCDTCGTTSCNCALAGSEACGAARGCDEDPCGARSASCWQGHCLVRPAPAGPCTADSECEVRPDDDHCDLFAALASAPRPGPTGRGCGTRPAPHQYRARCDTDASRCVLERAPGT